MNWIRKILIAGQNIKERIKERASREELKSSKWMPSCCGSAPVLKETIFNEEQLNTCPNDNCQFHYPFPCRSRFDHFYGKNNWKEIDTPRIPDDPLSWPNDVYKKKLVHLFKPTKILLFILSLQVILGIYTLVSGLNIYFASLHQITSVMLVFSALNLYYFRAK